MYTNTILKEPKKQPLHTNIEKFNELVTQYHPNVYSLAFNYLLNEQDAQDASQEVFIKLYNTIKKLDTTISLLPWLHTVTRNVCLNFIRDNKRKLPVQEQADPNKAKQIEEMREVISRMDEPYRSILIYKFTCGLDNDECSRLLKIKRSNFRVSLSRALQKLREKIFSGGEK